VVINLISSAIMALFGVGPGDGNDSVLDLFSLLDDDTILLDNIWDGTEPDFGQHQQQGQQCDADMMMVAPAGLAESAAGVQLLNRAALGPVAGDMAPPAAAAGQQGWYQADPPPAAAGQGPRLFSSAEAATRYADTAALVAAAQAEMDAASPGHSGAVQLQKVVSATSAQLHKMACTALSVGKGAPGAAGVDTERQQKQQQQQLQQPAWAQQQQMQQQHQRQTGSSQQQHVPVPQFKAPQLPQQQQQAQAQHKPPPFSAATLAKAAAISGTPAQQQSTATPFNISPAQHTGLGTLPGMPASTAASAASLGSMQGAGLQDMFQRRRPTSGNSGVLEPSLAAVAGAAHATGAAGAASAPIAAAQMQQGAWGFTLPDHFKGVMLTPAGAVTGVC
jgi:hypothetical protein